MRELPIDHVFYGLNRNYYGTILCDAPWRYETWNKPTAIPRGRSGGTNVSADVHYSTMTTDEIAALPVLDLATEDCCLFMWATWPMLKAAMRVIEAWSFSYKTCAFDWMKGNGSQIDMFRDDLDTHMGMGFWTRANSEPCLLATRGKPKRSNADVRMGIFEPRRQHSRKPDCVYERIERLVVGPRVELFARTERSDWSSWGNETSKFKAPSFGTQGEELLT